MGVHGLWELLSPVGVRVSNEHVCGKVLAVDVSIWLTQFVKAMRDAEGAQIRNAHLLGVFRRCIKLLFLSVRPVLVFDGATPALKRRTLASRRAQRERHAAKLRKLAEKLLLNQMQTRAINAAISNHVVERSHGKRPATAASRERSEVIDDASDEDRIKPVEVSDANGSRHGHDGAPQVSWADKNSSSKGTLMQDLDDEDKIEPVYKTKGTTAGLHAAPEGQSTAKESGFVFYTDDLADDEEIISRNPNAEDIALPYDLDDIDDEALGGLPHNIQAEVFKQMKLQQRAKHRECMMLKKNDPSEFSKTQIEGFLRNTALSRKISSVRNAINDKSGASQRIASDSARQYILKETENATVGDTDASDFEEDSDDILNTPILSVQRKQTSVVRGTPDILARIRANRDVLQSLHQNEEERKTTRIKADQEKRSGVAWASKVLEGQGGLQLGGRSSLGNLLPNKLKADRDSLDDCIQNLNEIQEMSGNEKVSHQSDDEDEDIEWEDGSNNKDISFEMRFAPSRSTGEENKLDVQEAGVVVESAIVQQSHSRRNIRIPREGCLHDKRVSLDSEKSPQDVPKYGGAQKLSPHTRHNNVNSVQAAEGDSPVTKKMNRRQVIFDELDYEEELLHAQTGTRADTVKSIPESNTSSPISKKTNRQRMILEELESEKENLQSQEDKESPNQQGNSQSIATERDNSHRFTSQSGSEGSKDSVDDPRSRRNSGRDIGISSNHAGAERYISPWTKAGNGSKIEEAKHSLPKSKAAEEEERNVQLAIALSLQCAAPSESPIGYGEKNRVTNLESRSALEEKACFPSTSANENNESDFPVRNNTEGEGKPGIDEKTNTEKELSQSDTVLALSHSAEQLMQRPPQRPIEVTKEDIELPTQQADVLFDLEEPNQYEGDEMSPEQMQELRDELELEALDIRKKRASHQGGTETLSDEMYSETRDLLKLFGIPYIEAPTEAEAQCAFFNMERMVDGIITEDSDAFLFGARTVYRRLFSDGRFAETYDSRDIESNLGLNRELLIRLAYLLGSDYTSGVRGVGIVNSMEILEAFPGEEGLVEFHKWTRSVTVLDEEPGEEVMKGTSQDAVRRQFCWKHRNMKRNWEIREGFPNAAVAEAYRKPDVDTNKERFRWGAVDFNGLGRFCWEKFGWEKDSFETAVGPLRKKLAEGDGAHQTRIDDFFRPHRFAKIRSARLQTAVHGMAGEEARELMAEIRPQIRKRKRLPIAHLPPPDLNEEAEMVAAVEEAERVNEARVKGRVRKRARRKSEDASSSDLE